MRHTVQATMLGLVVLAGGCAHDKANQYAYAPPLAPPVYPQPQAPPPAAGVVAAPLAAPPNAAVMAAPVMAAPQGFAAMPGAVQPATVDPCCNPIEGAATPVVWEAAGQTPPCPPGP